MIPAVIEKIKAKLALAIPVGTPIMLVNEIIDTHNFFDTNNFVYVIKNSNIFTQFFTV